MKKFIVVALLGLLSGCDLLEEKCDSAPDGTQSTSFNVNNSGFGNCLVAVPGFPIKLDWGYMYGSDGQKNGNNSGYTKFRWTFEPALGFVGEDGTPIDGEYVTEDNSPSIYALPDAPARTTIRVRAFNDCGESTEASESIEVVTEKAVELISFMPQAASAPIVGYSNNKVHVLFGNYNGGYSNTNEGKEVFVYDFTTRKWSSKPLPSTGGISIRNRYTQVQVDGKVYMINRVDNGLFAYEIESNTITRLSDNPYHNKNGDYNGQQALSYNNKIYIGPGRYDYSTQFHIFTYDPVTDTWADEHVMPESVAPPQEGSMREFGESAFIADNKMYFLMDGGQGYVYDPQTKTGSKFSISLRANEHIGGSFVHEGVPYLITNGNGSTVDGQLFRMDLQTYQLTTVRLRQNNSCVVNSDEWVGPAIMTRTLDINGDIYVIGGSRACGSNTPCNSDIFLKLHL